MVQLLFSTMPCHWTQKNSFLFRFASYASKYNIFSPSLPDHCGIKITSPLFPQRLLVKSSFARSQNEQEEWQCCILKRTRLIVGISVGTSQQSAQWMLTFVALTSLSETCTTTITKKHVETTNSFKKNTSGLCKHLHIFHEVSCPQLILIPCGAQIT